MLKPINIKSAFNINFNDKIKKAYLKNRDNIKKTPLQYSNYLSKKYNNNVYLKRESTEDEIDYIDENQQYDY